MAQLFKVLLVDDDKNIREALKTLISRSMGRRLNIHFRELDNGAEVLDYILIYRPDLVLLDIMMPQPNGLQVLQQLKESKNKHVAMTPIIVLTGVDNVDIQHRCKKLGAVDYITKPWDAEGRILIHKIHKSLRKKGKRLTDAQSIFGPV